MPEFDSPLPAAHLAYLRCPESRQTLRVAEPALLARINAAIAGGNFRNRSATVLTRPLEGGLLREDGEVLYPILDRIPNLISDEGIARGEWEGVG